MSSLVKRTFFLMSTPTLRKVVKDANGKTVKLKYDDVNWSGRTGLIKSYTIKGKTVELLDDAEFAYVSDLLAAKWTPKIQKKKK